MGNYSDQFHTVHVELDFHKDDFAVVVASSSTVGYECSVSIMVSPKMSTHSLSPIWSVEVRLANQTSQVCSPKNCAVPQASIAESYPQHRTCLQLKLMNHLELLVHLNAIIC